MAAPADSLDGRVAEVIHRLLAVAEDLLDCALSGRDDLQGFVRDYVRTRKGRTFLRIPAWELLDALEKPWAGSQRPVPVTRKEAAELLLRFHEDCQGSNDGLPIAPNPEFLAEVSTLLARLPTDLFDEEGD